MQWNRNQQRCRIDVTSKQLGDGLGQHSAQRTGDRRDVLILQQMDESAQAFPIFAERCCPVKIRRRIAAIRAEAIAPQQLSAGQAVATDYALRRSRRDNSGQAFPTYGNSGDVIERRATEFAIGRKQDREDTLCENLEGHKSHSALPGAQVSPGSS